jgi:hypothetical protein
MTHVTPFFFKKKSVFRPFVPYLGWVSLQRSCLSDPCNPFFLKSVFRQSNSVSTLSVRYKLSRVGFVLMVPLLVLAVSFHGWVQLQRSCVSDPCNTLLLEKKKASFVPEVERFLV